MNDLRNYSLVTGAYWGFTLTDGALRMLVLLHFHQLGYTPIQIALLFLLYEFFGVITNLIGGWLGSHFGLNCSLSDACPARPELVYSFFRDLCHGFPGSFRHRQRSDQDEF
jgi:hypothetical protein